MKEVGQKLRQELQWFHTGSVSYGVSTKLRNRTARNSDMPTQARCSERKRRQALSQYTGKIWAKQTISAKTLRPRVTLTCFGSRRKFDN